MMQTNVKIIKQDNTTFNSLSIDELPQPAWIWFQNPQSLSCYSNFAFTVPVKIQCVSQSIFLFIKSTGKVTVVLKDKLIYVKENHFGIVNVSNSSMESKLGCNEILSIQIKIQHSGQQTQSLQNCNKFGVAYGVQQQKCCPFPFGMSYNSSQCLCSSICGDGILLSGPGMEDCDDENTVNGDGCNSECKIQDNYSCSTELYQKSECSRKHELILKRIQKQKNQNKFKLYLKIEPLGKQFEELDFLKYLSNSNQESMILRQFNYSLQNNSLLTLKYQYFQSLNGHIAQINFEHSESNNLQRVIISRFILNFSHEGNFFGYYTPETYQNAQTIKPILKGCLAVTYFLLFIGIFTRFKLIALQTLFIYKFAYFNTVGYLQINPITQSIISALEYSNGYNWRLNIYNSPSKLFSIQYETSLMGNINIMIIILAVSYILYYFAPSGKLRSFFSNLSIVVALIGASDLGFSFNVFIFSVTSINFLVCIVYMLLFVGIRYALKYSEICNATEQFNFENFAPMRRIQNRRGRRTRTTDPYPAELDLMHGLHAIFIFATFYLGGAIFTIFVMILFGFRFLTLRQHNDDQIYKSRKNEMMNLFCFVKATCLVIMFAMNMVCFYIDVIFLTYVQVVIIVMFTMYSVVAMILFTLKKKHVQYLIRRQQKKLYQQKQIVLDLVNNQIEQQPHNKSSRSNQSEIEMKDSLPAQQNLNVNQNQQMRLLEE